MNYPRQRIFLLLDIHCQRPTLSFDIFMPLDLKVQLGLNDFGYLIRILMGMSRGGLRILLEEA